MSQAVFYDNDMDGVMAALTVRGIVDGSATFHPQDHVVCIPDVGMLPDAVETLWFLDTPGIPPTAVRDWAKRFEAIYYVDHHKTTIQAFEGEGMPDNVHLIFGDECSAMLTHKYLWTKEPSHAVVLTNDWDLWKHEHDDTIGFRHYVEANKDPSRWHNLEGILDMGLEQFRDTWAMFAGDNVAAFNASVVRDQIAAAHTLDFFGHTVHVVTSHDPSIAAMGVSDLPVIILVHKPLGIQVSLRPHGAFDGAEMAKKFGGGGHTNAAGFQLYWDRDAELILALMAPGSRISDNKRIILAH